MYQLTYISNAATGLDERELEDILAASRRNNRNYGITGILIYDGKRFLQALEGDMATVEPTFLRIDRDSRHQGVNVLSIHDVSARQFGEWDMACHRAQPAPEGTSFAETVEALVANLADRNMQALFQRFAREAVD